MKPFKLNTQVAVPASEWKINLDSKIVTIGSCFAEVMGQQLGSYKFPVLNNPFGTVFNPLTICKLLDSALSERLPSPALYTENADKICFHHDFHSSLWAPDKAQLEQKLTRILSEVKSFLNIADVLVITFGTAYAYRHKLANTLIGNCHKVPADRFVKELLHPDQINIPLEQLILKLRSFRRDLRVILTVSPVRHTKDTLPLNQVSKSTLRLLCHRLSERFPNVDYFPSYEIMIDELRDYRFYEQDLIHPNSMAEEYIFRTFADAFIDPSLTDFMKEWESVRQLMQHRPLYGHTESQYKMLQNVQARLTRVADVTDVSAELAEVARRIREFPGNY
ncbi:GSCFA domain-containing protein [Dyadobacter luteus]|uniref:GSCFA domain-containing protein n=1 Tax=Dyadobacter luteus TaxID=2259619 RepID=A0A3D8Y3Z3_9BACT|nr:GSCFA domain-containing protein [Dyadobacter luteus]REA56705.1 GSCFA domain-containing protein [Dyadobacter luteus]